MKTKYSKKILAILMIPLIIALIYPVTADCQYGSSPVFPAFQKGMAYVTWSREGFSSTKSDESLQSMRDAGIGYVSIIVTWYQENYDSVKMVATDRSPSDESLRHVIRVAHRLGMAVMLKPHIDLINGDGYSRADIGFQSEEKWAEWGRNYMAFISHYARISAEEGVEILCMGTELTFASTRTAMWTEMIDKTRKAYKGRLTYAANWDEYKNVEFWDKLDYAGIDAYFPLAKESKPTYDTIKEGWKKWLTEIEEWHASVNKPVIFTEIGYCSADSAAKKPWEEAFSGASNTQLQADCYKAAFEALWNKEWFYGIYWWNWNTYPGSGGEKNKGFTPQNKLALDQVKEWYARADMKLPVNAAAISLAKAEFDEKLSVESSIKIPAARNIAFTGQMAGRKKYMDYK